MNYKYPLHLQEDNKAIQRASQILRCLVLVALCSLPIFSASAAEARSRQQAIDIALQQNGGDAKVLGVQTIQTQDGRTVFAVKVLSNGRVRVFRINKVE